jgi:hypothetical protein
LRERAWCTYEEALDKLNPDVPAYRDEMERVLEAAVRELGGDE